MPLSGRDHDRPDVALVALVVAVGRILRAAVLAAAKTTEGVNVAHGRR